MKAVEQVTLELTITVTYNLNGEEAEAMQENLNWLPRLAAGEGLFTGDTAAEVDEWKWTVKEIKEAK